MRTPRRRPSPSADPAPAVASPDNAAPHDGAGIRASATVPRRRLWPAVVVALVVVALGSAAAVVGAGSVARSNGDRSRRSFETASAEIASTLQLTIQHEEDLVVAVGGFVAQDESATQTSFREWISATRVLERYPELQGVGFLKVVTADELPAFVAAQAADPVAPPPAGGSYTVNPAGDRPFYCLISLGVYRQPLLEATSGIDACIGEQGTALFASRDEGLGTYGTFEIAPGFNVLGVQQPIYRGDAVPETVEARRASFVGWSAYLVDSSVVLGRAVATHPEVAVAYRFHQGSYDVTFRSGVPPASGAASKLVDLHNGWSLETFGRVDSSAILDNRQASVVMIGGIVLSLLLATLLLVLATGRIRALGLVNVKTGELRHQALHDALTGLPNRALIHDRIEQMLIRNRRNGTQGAALFVDLDGFKNVNDTQGHETGDLLLQAVAARLTGSLRDADTIGRMGGDEFVVLIDSSSQTVDPCLVAERLLEVMRQPFKIGESNPPMVVTTSVGIAVGDRATPGELLRDADVALYRAKDRGRNRYEVFSAQMESDVHHRQTLEYGLRAALAGHQFRLVYQPIYNLDDLSVVGVEALLRWDHPTLGEVQPDDFIPLLESSGQIMEVGAWVLSEACRQMAEWQARGSDLSVSVNVSGCQLDRDEIVGHVRDALTSSGLEPRMLTIEVTETALMLNVDNAARRLTELKALGVQIAIDDFGTGYSSLAYLQKLPVDCLKIDRSFTDAITRSPEADALINTLVHLGKDLGLRTLAEGVETAGQIDHLRSEHVNEAQGFLLARPLEPATLEERLLFPTRAVQRTPR